MPSVEAEGAYGGGAPPTKPLDEAALNALLKDTAERFDWPETADRYELAGSWASRTAEFYRCRGVPSGAPDLVLKVGREWSPEEARSLHGAMEALESSLTGSGKTRVRAPVALGWAEAPPSVCMGFLEGTSAGRILTDGDAWRERPWRPRDLLAECGRALGAYHAADATGATAAEVEGDPELRAAAATMLASRRLVARASRAIVVASRYFDIGPHQFLVTPQGDVFLLDPPVTPSSGPVQRDVARFLHGLHRTFDHGRSLGRRRRRYESILREAFLGGYAQAGPTDPRRPADRWLIALYEGYDAAATTRRRMATRHYGHAARHGADWLAWLIRLRIRRPPKR